MARYSFTLEVKVYDHLRKRNVDKKKFRFETLEDAQSILRLVQCHAIPAFIMDYPNDPLRPME
tara:strand:+ start:419 stop:607 length:189 start_codon:yes stop_codon:yes gene_type:complete